MRHINEILPKAIENIKTRAEKQDEKIKENVNILINLVHEELDRYTTDEAGENQRQKFLDMTDADKIALFVNTVVSCANWCDFQVDLVINFDYNNY